MSAHAERRDGLTPGHPRQPTGAGMGRGAVPLHLHAPADGACIRELPDGAQILAGNPGDHPLVLQLLVETRQAALADDFQSRLDEPAYRPSDRLLVRRDRRVVAHVHVVNRLGWFEGLRIPLMVLEDFASLPEFRTLGYAEELLASAESLAAGEGAMAGLIRAADPHALERCGWSPLRGQGYTRANARAVLAHLDAQEAARPKRRKAPLEIRTWRHFELDAIRTVYDKRAAVCWGPLLRSEAAWQWLVGRKAQDQILIAVDLKNASPEDSAGDLLRAGGLVTGYAIVRGSAIVEMMSLAEFPGARTQLLARACQDAMDRDHHSISLYTPAGDSLHELLVTAGGAWISDATSGQCWLAKLLALEKWVDRLYPLWHERARAADIARPFEVGFNLGEEGYRFTLTRRSARLERTRSLPAAQVACDRPALDSLLLGNLSAPAAVGAGRLRLSDPQLGPKLEAIFPPRLFWQSPLETMRL